MMKLVFPLLSSLLLLVGVRGQFPYRERNPAILHDTRSSHLDGTYQFQYSTQDGIQHISHARPDRVVEGVFGYTDPTGLKVNYHYSTGTVRQQEPLAISRPAKKAYFDYEDYDDGSYKPRSYKTRHVAAKPRHPDYYY